MGEIFMQQVRLVSTEDALTVALTGEIDSASSDEFYAEISAMYANDKKNVVFDCTALEFIDSTTLGTFVKIFKNLKADGNKLILKNMRPRIKKLFEICALDRIMEFE